MVQSLKEHDEIIQAIERGDAGRADQVSREHVMIQGERFNDLLAQVGLRQ
jgi:DNA-binding FadR family transcriptional regulator